MAELLTLSVQQKAEPLSSSQTLQVSSGGHLEPQVAWSMFEQTTQLNLTSSSFLVRPGSSSTRTCSLNVPAFTLGGLCVKNSLGRFPGRDQPAVSHPEGKELGICWKSHIGSKSRSSTGKPPAVPRTWPTRSPVFFNKLIHLILVEISWFSVSFHSYSKTLVASFILVGFTQTLLFISIQILVLRMKELLVTFLDTNLLNEETSGSPREWEQGVGVLHSVISAIFLLFL